MAKTITHFVCQECGYDSLKYLGRCPECGEWNSMKEIRIAQEISSSHRLGATFQVEAKTPKKLSEINVAKQPRIITPFTELNVVLGGGIVPGSVLLLAGDPGIGKSTILLQVALGVAKGSVAGSAAHSSQNAHLDSQARATAPSESSSLPSPTHTSQEGPVLYISGEESEEQVKLRADRISKATIDNFLLLATTNTDEIVQIIQDLKPRLVIIDSIQTMESGNAGGLSGAVGQIRYAAARFIQVAKTVGIPLILVGHVTKEGMVAGPMTLSHMVDCVLFLEGERFTTTRILRSLKNRFGPVDEVGIFSMEGEGMHEVTNPEELFLSGGVKDKAVPGTVMVVTMEGTRAFLVELQALAVTSKLAYPRRIASGVDARRLELLLAVLQKHCRLPVDSHDIFVNVAGGLKIQDPAVDLGVCLAIFSSLTNTPMPQVVGIAEVGLLGELRKVTGLEKRIKEAKKLGFKSIFTPEKYQTLSDIIGTFKKI